MMRWGGRDMWCCLLGGSRVWLRWRRWWWGVIGCRLSGRHVLLGTRVDVRHEIMHLLLHHAEAGLLVLDQESSSAEVLRVSCSQD